MLAQLTISNFAIVRELEIDFHSGMTVITGETGAGKIGRASCRERVSADRCRSRWSPYH